MHTHSDSGSFISPYRLQAADMLRVTGIGRNEYIALMNA
jgi:hypothetical protein